MSSKQYNGLNSEFIYTSQNKWNVPQIIIRNYKCGNNDELLPGDYILEIIEGRILFRNKQSDLNINNGKAYGCELEFGEELESSEQPINVNYTYMSDRVPIYTIDSLKNVKTQDDIEKCVHTNKYVDVSVNRLGNYTVSVNAYDYYNNIFVNQSDDITTVTTKPISLDIILNESELVNNKDFYHYNAKGIYMNTSDTSKLFNDISTMVIIRFIHRPIEYMILILLQIVQILQNMIIYLMQQIHLNRETLLYLITLQNKF